MATTIIPSQLGYTAPNTASRSQIYLGKNFNVEFEAVGIGNDGRPDELQALKIHLSQAGVPLGAIYLDVTDIIALKATNPAIPSEVFLKLTEVSLCEVNDVTGETEEKRMIILGSPSYDPVS